jgi:RimJ/RimL family protein N-acetyltransferase
MKYGFKVLGLPRIVAVAWRENLASLGVMEKLGMTKAPRLYADKWVVYYFISREDYAHRNSAGHAV